MPYISKETRAQLKNEVVADGAPIMTSPGELNYEITLKIIQYMGVNVLSYQTINDILGALEGAKMEFYRRVAAMYEGNKMLENGDVYPEEFTR